MSVKPQYNYLDRGGREVCESDLSLRLVDCLWTVVDCIGDMLQNAYENCLNVCPSICPILVILVLKRGTLVKF